MIRTLLQFVDYTFFILIASSIGYLLVFSYFSLKRNKIEYPLSKRKLRYAVLFPSYKEDAVIVNSVKSFLKQDYPVELFDLIVISDKMQPETIEILNDLPIILLTVDFENSTKAKALNYAMHQLTDDYDGVIIFDADNTTDNNFLNNINNVYSSGVKAIQAHRVAKNMNTEVSILDGVSEEINNSIFRKGFFQAGLSASLSGSGMIFNYTWFKNNVSLLSSCGEDKEIEVLLLKESIRIHYLEDVYVYDEKVQKTAVFYNQRRRWLAAQYGTLKNCIKDIPEAIREKKYDYCNKLLQWTMLPRILLIGLTCTITFICLILDWHTAIKWLVLLLLLFISLVLAIPRNMLNRRLLKAIWRIPILFCLMFANLFRLKGAYEKFIHVRHDTN